MLCLCVITEPVSFLCHLEKRSLILCGNLAFRTLPGLEIMSDYRDIGLLMKTVQVQDGNILCVQVIPLLDQLNILSEFLETLRRCVRQLLIQLIQLEKYTGVTSV